MRQDALTIFTEIGKRSTNLSLALRRSASSQAQSQTSPTQGLDAASIAAAQQQIDAMTNDLLPKLVFLAQKASKERSVYVVREPNTADTADAAATASEERRKMEEMAKEMGGKVMTGAELGLTPAASASSAQYVKQANLGIGATWARILRVHTQDVLQSVATLGEACMDSRTKKAVRAAQRARDRFDGVQSSGEKESTEEEVATREQCLAKTAAVWDACDQAVKSLPTDNLAAVKMRWKNRRELMQDGLEEMKEAVEEEGGGASDAEDDDDDDLGLSLSTMTLDAPQKQLIERLTPLIRMGRLLHDRVGNEIKDATGGKATDIDELDHKGSALAEAQDDLVAALLYGEDPANDQDDGEDEQDDEEVAPENAIRLTGTRAVAELYLDAARQLVTSDQDSKAQMIVEEMVKLVDGIEESAWPRAE